MTAAGLRVLGGLADGESHMVAGLAADVQLCQRKTRGALNGCVVAGLATRRLVDRAGSTLSSMVFQITPAGTEALEQP